jgi:hypothetical protein
MIALGQSSFNPHARVGRDNLLDNNTSQLTFQSTRPRGQGKRI